MTEFHLQIVTPDGLIYDGTAERVVVRTITGEVGILANHIDFVTALGMGQARILMGGSVRKAACIGGMLTVTGGEVKIVATTFEWAEDIDLARAERAYSRAKERLDTPDLSAREIRIAEAKLKRALVRKGVASDK